MLLCLATLLCPATSTTPRSRPPESTSATTHTIMSIYHHIHHMELHHRAQGHTDYQSVLLDLTRQRMAKHFGVDYSLDPPQEPLSPDNNNHQYPSWPDPQQSPQLVNQRPNSRLSNNFQSANEGTSIFGTPLPDDPPDGSSNTPQAPQAPETPKAETPKAPRSKPVLLADEEVSRALATSEDFQIAPVWDGAPLVPDAKDPQSDCQDICDCLASELLFGITRGVLPYRPNDQLSPEFQDDPAFPGADYQVFRFASVPDETIPIWYRNFNDQWYWTPYNPTSRGIAVCLVCCLPYRENND